MVAKYMITKEEEYMAETCKIGGFAFIAPFGKVIFSIPYVELFAVTISQLLYAMLAISFACIGMMLIFKGKEILREKEI